jgi:hypothetical protein
MKPIIKICIIFFSFVFATLYAHAQDEKKGILVPAIIIDGDTMYIDQLETVYFNETGDGSRKKEIDRLRYNVYKVFPYAVLASNVLKKMDQDLGSNASRKERKKYINKLDIELNAQFKEELKNLSVTQGKILVKLINRQTGRSAYEVIKDLKGGMNARFYQTAFSFIDNNLKANYDPFGEDRDIEMIVKEIEAGNYFKNQTINTRVKK